MEFDTEDIPASDGWYLDVSAAERWRGHFSVALECYADHESAWPRYFTPAQAREIAAGLLQIADEVEKQNEPPNKQIRSIPTNAANEAAPANL